MIIASIKYQLISLIFNLFQSVRLFVCLLVRSIKNRHLIGQCNDVTANMAVWQCACASQPVNQPSFFSFVPHQLCHLKHVTFASEVLCRVATLLQCLPLACSGSAVHGIARKKECHQHGTTSLSTRTSTS